MRTPMRTLTLAVVVSLAVAAGACSEGARPLTGPTVPTAVGALEQGEATSPASAQAAVKAPRPADLAVTTVIEAFQPSEISGDGAPYIHNQSGVSSILTANTCNGLTWGDWRFDTSNSSRLVGHSFWSDTAVAPGSWGYTIEPKPPFAGTEALKSDLNVQCTCAMNRSMLAMGAGTSMECPLNNRFVRTNGDVYTLNNGAVHHPGDTTNARIKCLGETSVAPAGCAEWVIEPGPGPDFPDRGVGRLAQHLSKGKIRVVPLGNFYLRFRIRITRP